MAIGPDQVGKKIELNEIDEAKANDLDDRIEKKLSSSEEGKDSYIFYIEIGERLSEDIVKTVKRRYLKLNWKEVCIDTEGHTQFDSGDEPFIYTVELKA
ncbi:hypothetical protein KAS31_04725 [Candidatus Parcubacteria bacterium]|nr:hypothetical protein [Candidatus Parcubacteria bacterium]